MTPRNAMEQRAAKTVGLLLLLAPMTIMAVSYGIIWPLVSGLEAPQAARNIVTHETLYRVGLVGNLLYTVELVVLSAAIYVMLRPVDPLLALLAALGRLFHAITWVVICVNLFASLRLLTDAEYQVPSRPVSCTCWRGCSSRASTGTASRCCSGRWERWSPPGRGCGRARSARAGGLRCRLQRMGRVLHREPIPVPRVPQHRPLGVVRCAHARVRASCRSFAVLPGPTHSAHVAE